MIGTPGICNATKIYRDSKTNLRACVANISRIPDLKVDTAFIRIKILN